MQTAAIQTIAAAQTAARMSVTANAVASFDAGIGGLAVNTCGRRLFRRCA